ncbi:MAG: hypothetical protein O2931_13380 [Planctomycetota bacterium]|nr:hypothetical protein [Planctomycetota bacterium]MDA1179775.1 hypothetical protein [Planctomycetota bacterium]
MAKCRAVLTNLFILSFLVLILIDGFPSVGLFHSRAKDWIDPIIDVTGIWQGGWSVFAPRINRDNYHIEARIEYSKGHVADWRTPHWRDISVWENLCSYREMKFGEHLSQVEYTAIRPDFAQYLSRKFRPADDEGPAKVRIDNHYFNIWPPREGDEQPLPVQTGHWFVKTLYEGEVP